MIPDCTLVTACFDLSKYNPLSRTVEETINGMAILLMSPIYLIVHSDSVFMDTIKKKREENGFSAITFYIEESYEDLWCSTLTSRVKSNREIYWSSRDERTCAESHLLTCNKFSFVLKAIETNPFDTTRFGWIDMNLKKNDGETHIKICEDYTSNRIPYVLSQIKDDKFHIQIMGVNDKKFLLPENKKEYYDRYRWVVCGCFFVCGKDIGLKILNRLNDVVTTTTNNGYGHGEEPMYFDVLDEFHNDIIRSFGDYGQILNNFQNPVKNLWYIFHNIACRYYSLGYFSECCECCLIVLNSFDNHLLEMDSNLYCQIKCLLNNISGELYL